MARIPYAAKQFLDEVGVEKYDEQDLDGWNVYRTLRFGKRDSKRIGEALLFIEDERIDDWHVTDAGYLHVTFVTGPEADERDPFDFEDALLVAKSSRE